MIIKFKLFESPDSVDHPTKWLSCDNGIPFAISKENNKVKFGHLGEYHSSGEDEESDLITNCKYPGRIWIEFKCISFWVYPKIEEFSDIIKQIEDHYNIKIFNNDWLMEIYETDKGIAGKDISNGDNNVYNPRYGVGEYKLIPIDEYIGSENAPEEERAIHLLNYNQKQELKKKGWGKGWGSDMTAWDGKNPLWWRMLKYQENMKYIQPFKLNENPDYIDSEKSKTLFGNQDFAHMDVDSITFGYLDDKMCAGRFNMTHSDFQSPDGSASRFKMKYPGRLWKDSKVISFWQYPPPEDLRKLIKDIEDSYNDKFIGNITICQKQNGQTSTLICNEYHTFKTDNDKITFNVKNFDKFILKSDNNFEIIGIEDSDKVKTMSEIYEFILNTGNTEIWISGRYYMKDSDKLEITNDWLIEIRTEGNEENRCWYGNKNVDYVKISDYIGSEKVSDEEMAKAHVDWKMKDELKKKGWGKGWGSDMTAWDGKNPLWWRMLKYQENMKYKK